MRTITVYFLVGISLIGTSSYGQLIEKRREHQEKVEGSAILKKPVFIEILRDDSEVDKSLISEGEYDEEILFVSNKNVLNKLSNKNEMYDEHGINRTIINKADEDGLIISNTMDAVKETIHNFMDKSNWEMAVSLGSYHDRKYYSPKQINRYNERNAGFGVGLVYTSEAKNEHSIKFLQISDSESNQQQILGYQYMYNLFKNDVDVQIGFLGGISSRRFERKNQRSLMPVFMPTLGLKLWNLKVNTTYVPKVKIQGGKYGGFFYAWGTYEFK